MYKNIFIEVLVKNISTIPRLTVYLITLIACFSSSVRAQNYQIGHQTVSFTDSTRGNRPVPSEIYYPSAQAGENTPPEAGSFPVIVFGHGFQMAYDSYFYFKNAMVPAGYIVVFPKTETSLSPSHAEYGADLAFLVLQMKAEGLNPGSLFFQHVDSTSAIMGHSMGGGASFLGCKNNTTPAAMVTWAAAETNPSAIASAHDITIPALVFAADKDCVTPPATNQVPMYDSLASDCKVYINIKGGGHCYFADANFLCSLGEFGCPPFTITREQQHATTLDFTKLYLDHYLKNQTNAWITFLDSLNHSPRITFQKSCTTTALPADRQNIPFRIFPNPSENMACIEGACSSREQILVDIADISGRKIQHAVIVPDDGQFRMMLHMNEWARGIYFAEIRDLQNTRVIKIVKN
jgi:pimeloyl-ACP methyl ester carboxylesterase